MQRKKLFLVLFILLSLVNICIFFYRDHFRFQYYASYQSLYKPCDKVCSDKWETFVHDYPAIEFNEAKSISDTIVQIRTPTLDKVVTIGHFLRHRFEKQLGKPTIELMVSSPMSQFRQLSSNDSVQLWCGNFVQMFSYFCWSQGIVCRNIEIMNAGDHHMVNECYLPESGQWMLVDLTNNILAASGKNKSMLNYVDFRKAVNDSSGITAWRSANDSLVLTEISSFPFRTYYKPTNPVLFYHSMDYLQKITTANKIKHYLLPVYWYEILGIGKGNNFLFYLKLAFIALWTGSFFVFLFSHTKFRI